MNLNFDPKDKEIIVQAENNRGYTYYEFTEDKVKAIAAKPVREIEYDEWCCLLQMLYPTGLICSGLFDPFLVFEIVNGKRKDPPKESWPSLNKEGSSGILLERFAKELTDHGIEMHDTWHELLAKHGRVSLWRKTR